MIAQGLNRGMSTNIWNQRRANYTKFTEQSLMWTEMNGQNIGLPLQTFVEKRVQWAKTHWLSGKEKIQGTVISSEDNQYSGTWKDLSLINLFEKGAIVNSSSYCQLLRQFIYFIYRMILVYSGFIYQKTIRNWSNKIVRIWYKQ